MKVVAFDGSATRGGRIAALLGRALAELEAGSVETELLYLQKDRRTGCYACGQCAQKLDASCSRPAEDGLRRCVRKVLAADGVLVGSPAYAAGASPATQALLQRLEHSGRRGRLSRKVVAAVVDARSAGAARTAAGLGLWFEAHGMVVVDSPSAIGRAVSAVELTDDWEESMARLGRAMMAALLDTFGE